MKKYLLGALVALVLVFSVAGFAYKMSVLQAPDGIQIGSDTGGRLPIYEFDEYPFQFEEENVTAGEIRTISLGEVETFHGGAQCFSEVLNSEIYNNPYMDIRHTWYDCSGETCDLKVMIQNMATTTKSFGDQIVVSCWNTTGFSELKKSVVDGKTVLHRSR